MEEKLYNDDEFCMKFSNKDICEYFVIPINEFLRSDVDVVFCDKRYFGTGEEWYDEPGVYKRFTNEEMYKYFISPTNEASGYETEIVSNNETIDIGVDRNKLICDVIIDGDKEDYFIAFYEYMTGLIFLNEEIIFLDDSVRDEVGNGDTFNNVVYEGSLRDKTHKEMLSMFVEIYKILLDVDRFEIDFQPTGENHTNYEIYNYTILCKSKSGQKFKKRFDNILFIVE